MGFTLGKLVRPRIVCATTTVEWSGVEEERSGGYDNQKPRPISKYITNEPARHAKCSAAARRRSCFTEAGNYCPSKYSKCPSGGRAKMQGEGKPGFHMIPARHWTQTKT